MKTVSLHDFYPTSIHPLQLSDAQARHLSEALVQQLERQAEHHLLLDCRQVPDLTVSVCLILLPALLNWNQQHPNQLVFSQVSKTLQQTLNATLVYAKAQGLLSEHATTLLFWQGTDHFQLLGPLPPALGKTWEQVESMAHSVRTLAEKRAISISTTRRHLSLLTRMRLIQCKPQGQSLTYHRLLVPEPAIPPQPLLPDWIDPFDTPEEKALQALYQSHQAMVDEYKRMVYPPLDVPA